MTVKLAVIIPTRNRGPLAADAVRSLLDQDCAMEIFVSDNSTVPCELGDLLRHDGVHYLRPERELTSGDHWDWAVRQVMERSRATHFVVQHDRRWSKPRSWGAIEAIATRWPDLLITFGTDSITATPPPLRVWQMPWTGKVFTIRSARAASLIASARIAESVHALPLLVSCVVPRRIAEAIIDRFGDLCRANGPDTAFLARFLALEDTYLHADQATGILYASHRSTNLGYLQGGGGDFSDLMELHGNRPWLDAAPVPGLNLGFNFVYHEYERVRRETGDRLPPLDREACIEEMADALKWVKDRRTRGELRRVLAGHGWTGPVGSPAGGTWPRIRAWILRARALGAVGPNGVSGFPFRSDSVALRYALKHPRMPQDSAAHLQILEPQEVHSA